MINGRAYMVNGSLAQANPTKSSFLVASTGATRPCIYDFFLSSSAAPADNAILWKIQRSTANGTGSYTPTALDPGDAAGTATAQASLSAEPTYTANAFLFWLALNQRATHRAILDPSRPLSAPATNANGMGCYSINTTFTGFVDTTCWYYE